MTRELEPHYGLPGSFIRTVNFAVDHGEPRYALPGSFIRTVNLADDHGEPSLGTAWTLH